MSRNRFVLPETVRLELSDGDWIEVKKRLTYGEQQRLAGGALRPKLTDGEIDISLDLETHSVLRLSTWLVDWSFCDFRGKQVPVSGDAITSLDPDTVEEIEDVLTAHIRTLEEEKKRGGLAETRQVRGADHAPHELEP